MQQEMITLSEAEHLVSVLVYFVAVHDVLFSITLSIGTFFASLVLFYLPRL